MPSNSDICGTCQERDPLKKSGAGWIGCDMCAVWFHGECQSIPKKDITKASALNKENGFMWFCSLCRTKVTRTDQPTEPPLTVTPQVSPLAQNTGTHFESILSKLTSQMQASFTKMEASLDLKMEEKLKRQVQPRQPCPAWPGLAPSSHPTQPQTARPTYSELVSSNIPARPLNPTLFQANMLTRGGKGLTQAPTPPVALPPQVPRERNIIIFGIREGDGHTHDKDELTELIQNRLGLYAGTQVTPTDIKRLGIRQSDTDRPRPIKLTVENTSTKWAILKTLNSRRIQGIFSRPDLTPEEQKRDYALRTELNEARRTHTDKKWTISRGVVVELPISFPQASSPSRENTTLPTIIPSSPAFTSSPNTKNSSSPDLTDLGNLENLTLVDGQ